MEKRVKKSVAAAIYRSNNKRVVDSDVKGFVVLKDVNKVYANRVQAVFDFNLSVEKNEFIVLVGPSGCGKSTTLRMIAGLEEITDGYLYIDQVLSNYLESKDRDIAMVFQSYALYPNMTVFDNIGFGLKVRGVPKDEIKQKVFDVAQILDLGSYLDRKPRELSGGQMQRVALGRAIVRHSKLFLMDEPLSNLDAKLRVQMRSEIVKLHKNVHATTIYVTHDQTEAMTMADRIVIMNKGVVQQIGTPMEIYNDPHNVFVATFIGSPPMNVFKTEITGGKLICDNAVITLPRGAEQKYKRFIAERKRFFYEFREKANLDSERTLLCAIEKFLHAMRFWNGTTRALELDAICCEAKRLSEYKGFIKFDDDNISAIKANIGKYAMREDQVYALIDRIYAFVRTIKGHDAGEHGDELETICEMIKGFTQSNANGGFDDSVSAADDGSGVDKDGYIAFGDNSAAVLRNFYASSDMFGLKCALAYIVRTFKALLRTDFSGLKRDLTALAVEIKNTDLAIAGILKKFDSAGVFKTKNSTDEQKLAELDKRGKKKKPVKLDVMANNVKLIDKYIAAYSAPEAAEQAFVGIRPEDIRFADYSGNKTETFKTEASFVELLGSEFNIYVDMFGSRLIMKSPVSRIVKTGDSVELCFDMDKLRLFDSISCERVI